MSLHDDFRRLATTLVELDARRPRSIHLRQAVSAAYYAVFHRLISDATTSMLGRGRAISTSNPANPQTLRLDHEVGRWFNHGQMRRVSDWFAHPATAPKTIKGLLTYKADPFVPQPLRKLASYVGDLQEARHAADYDPSHVLDRTSARRIVAKADDAFALCDGMGSDPMYRLYLLLMLGGEAVARDRA